MGVLASFHPAVRRWFEGRFPEGPSEPQVAGWPAIARREHTLIAAPTGSGKTLAAFLVCINNFYLRTVPEEGAETVRSRGEKADGGAPVFTLDPGPAAVRPRARVKGYVPVAAPSARPEGGVERPPGIEVLYLSPLKALAADIQQNLEGPLAEIEGVARTMGLPVPEIRVGMRSGDTPASARASMLKKPPQILVTTPESLYLLLTSQKGRETLRTVQTVIVDEIHAMARDKRGSHLSLSLERLEALCDSSPTRVGLSATQRPIERVAKLLVGVGPDRIDSEGRPRCTIVDEGHRRALDLETVLPGSELEAVASGEQMGEVLDRIAEQVEHHKTTLIFVNTRRMAERLAHQLAERLGAEGVAAHHGSLSRNRRLRVETALREGRLRALVATASLELGIDIGPVELVCQIGSPRSIATFLQRVGRSGHFRGGTPKGRIYPLTRDELVECTGLLRGVRAGRLDRLLPPKAPLDILAQQIVAACAAEPWKEADLYALFVRSAAFEGLTREVFDEVVELVSEGIETGRGRRAAYIHRDRIGGQLRARRGARLAALTSGGAIPEVADYRVIADPDETFIGSVGEDFAIDSLPGDVFLLGSSTWRILRVESGKVRVVDAEGANPNIPFWNGEAPARTAELSDEVSFLRRDLEPFLIAGDESKTTEWLLAETGIGMDAALQVARYLGVSRAALGGLPTRDRLVLERFFDDAGGMQLVIHTPRGGRLNRALCLALRKKFCKSFNFELQAAANDDSMVLSLGPHHSFPLADVPHFLSNHGIEETLQQAVLPTPLFSARWRWNLNRALTVLRFRGGKKNPPPIQRMESDDLMAAIFPQAAACQENVAGPIEIPNHVLVRQTLDDCLNEAMDVDGLRDMISRIQDGRLEILCVDTTEPSPLAHEILNGKPFTFLDDAPLEERRTRAVKMRRGLPVEERDLTSLAEDAIAKVREQATPAPRDRDELHDLLLGAGIWRADPRWSEFFRELEAMGRVLSFEVSASERGSGTLAAKAGTGEVEKACLVYWVATERIAWARALHPASFDYPEVDSEEPQLSKDLGPTLQSEPEWSQTIVAEDAAISHVLRGHLETTGPIDARSLAKRLSVRTGLVEIGLAALEAEGFVLRGRFEQRDEEGDPEASSLADQFCARRLLARIHGDSQTRLRASVEAVSAQDLMRFLFEWQHVAPGSQCVGPHGVGQIVEQFQGVDVAAGAWESEILAARVQGYRPEWLDPHCLSGQVSWLRLAPPGEDAARVQGADVGVGSGRAAASGRKEEAGGRRTRATSRSTPLSLVLRADLPWLLQAHRKDTGAAPHSRRSGGASLAIQAPLRGRSLEGKRAGATVSTETAPLAERILELLGQRGALFHSELVAGLDAQPVEVEAALWDLVSRGLVGADGFQALRSLLGSREGRSKSRAGTRARRGLRRGLAAGATAGAEGRWSLVPQRSDVEDMDDLAEALAEQLLVRWGILFRDVVLRENLAVPWREIVWALRRLEARGAIRGGRFVSGFTGEQFALPEALELLGRVRRKPRTGERVRVCGSDPLNLVGILTPGARVPSRQGREVVYVDGLPSALEKTESAQIARSAPLDSLGQLARKAEAKPPALRHGRRTRGKHEGPGDGDTLVTKTAVPAKPGQLELG
jgi:ATP-dependent Lhr-like helicase